MYVELLAANIEVCILCRGGPTASGATATATDRWWYHDKATLDRAEPDAISTFYPFGCDRLKSAISLRIVMISPLLLSLSTWNQSRPKICKSITFAYLSIHPIAYFNSKFIMIAIFFSFVYLATCAAEDKAAATETKTETKENPAAAETKTETNEDKAADSTNTESESGKEFYCGQQNLRDCHKRSIKVSDWCELPLNSLFI
uniref:Uncharacterized protein n=1 Tax=Strigamia maritima TaxID=126957 RepID=T1JGF6_STRMM